MYDHARRNAFLFTVEDEYFKRKQGNPGMFFQSWIEVCSGKLPSSWEGDCAEMKTQNFAIKLSYLQIMFINVLINFAFN